MSAKSILRNVFDVIITALGGLVVFLAITGGVAAYTWIKDGDAQAITQPSGSILRPVSATSSQIEISYSGPAGRATAKLTIECGNGGRAVQRQTKIAFEGESNENESLVEFNYQGPTGQPLTSVALVCPVRDYQGTWRRRSTEKEGTSDD
jgi:hypothetical protein